MEKMLDEKEEMKIHKTYVNHVYRDASVQWATLSSGGVNQYSGHQSIERVILSMVKGEITTLLHWHSAR